MKYLGKNVLFILLVIFAMASCDTNETTSHLLEDERTILLRNLNSVETDEFKFEGIKYPKGTIIYHNTESKATITFPDNYEFVYENELGNLRTGKDICYECTCVGETTGGCDVDYGVGGFGCFHGDRCGKTCSGSHVDCDDDSQVSLIGIYDYSKSISFIKKNESYETLNQFIYYSEDVLIKHRNSILDVNESLFSENYL